MKTVIAGLIFGTLVIFSRRNALRRRYKKRQDYIYNYVFPQKISARIVEVYPHLEEHQVKEVISGLRDYFYLCSRSPQGMVSMPSQVVDVAWHEFILFTRAYQEFCQKAFGRFLHHTPAEAMTHPQQAQLGLKRAWKLACGLDDLSTNTKKGKGLSLRKDPLPLLFELDSKLKIPDGFHYQRDCSTGNNVRSSRNDSGNNRTFCADEIGCSSAISAYGFWGALAMSQNGSFSNLDFKVIGDSGGGGDTADCGGGCGGGCGGD